MMHSCSVASIVVVILSPAFMLVKIAMKKGVQLQGEITVTEVLGALPVIVVPAMKCTATKA